MLTIKLSRAYSNLAVLEDHGEHGTDGEVDGDLIRHAIELLESVRTQGENDPYWNARMGYSCLMAYGSATTWTGISSDTPLSCWSPSAPRVRTIPTGMPGWATPA